MNQNETICDACRAQYTKGRYDEPHHKLRVVSVTKDVGHMFGGGHETHYKCDDCGELVIHSTDRTDPPWR
jgi:hypothetical protein